MESHAKAAGHSIHQQLVFFPMGLLVTATIFDVLWILTGTEGLATASYYMIAAGVIAGIAASIFGTIDYLAIPSGTRAKRVGLLHGVGNDVLLVLYAISWLVRPEESPHTPSSLAVTLGVGGALLAGATGWLGGELVDRLGVGVDPEAGLETPASYKTGIKLERN